MPNEQIHKSPNDSAKETTADQIEQSVDHFTDSIVHVVIRRNHLAKVNIAKQLIERGLGQINIERMLNIGVTELFK